MTALITIDSNLLFNVGAGVMVGSVVLGVAVGLVYTLGAKIQDFRYGVFYSAFALVASIGYCLGAIAFFFKFLTPEIAAFCSLVALGFLAGLVLLAVFVKKDNRVLFTILSFYSLLVVWLAPLFVWNLIYLIFIAGRSRPKPPELPAQPTTATPDR